MNFTKTKELSNFSGPASPYTVYKTGTRIIIGGTFILRPAVDENGFKALKYFASLLPIEDERLEELEHLISRIERLWEGNGESEKKVVPNQLDGTN